MPDKRINMRKISDILRLRFEAGLSYPTNCHRIKGDRSGSHRTR